MEVPQNRYNFWLKTVRKINQSNNILLTVKNYFQSGDTKTFYPEVSRFLAISGLAKLISGSFKIK